MDEYTRYCWVDFLFSKGANKIGRAFTCWKWRQIPISRELRLRSDSDYAGEAIPVCDILSVHSDGGAEFSGDFEVMCEQGGFAHVVSPPYTQSKNGVVEARIALIERPRESAERCRVVDTFMLHQIHRFYRDWQATVQERVHRRQGREVSRV